MGFVNIFFQSAPCFLTLLTGSFKQHIFVILLKSDYHSFLWIVFGVITTKSLPNSWPQRFLLGFLLKFYTLRFNIPACDPFSPNFSISSDVKMKVVVFACGHIIVLIPFVHLFVYFEHHTILITQPDFKTYYKAKISRMVFASK